MPIATLTPPATPWVVLASVNASDPTKWDLARSEGTAIATGVAQASVITTVADFMRTAAADLSTAVTILSPSNNPLVNAQLGDLPH
jgi:hypothetical protein